jgi:hypothetical protein
VPGADIDGTVGPGAVARATMPARASAGVIPPSDDRPRLRIVRRHVSRWGYRVFAKVANSPLLFGCAKKLFDLTR